MRPTITKVIAVLLVLVSVSVASYIILLDMVSPEFDMISQASSVWDGDTFDVESGDRIRLADINTPEEGTGGYEQASTYLEQLIYGQKVYLNVDDINRFDNTGERLVCVVYIDYNMTHYLNVNKALLDLDYAVIWEHDNEFNPQTWSLYVTKVSPESRRNLMIVSAAFGTLSTIIIVLVSWRGYRTGKRMVDRARGWVQEVKNRVKRRGKGMRAPLINIRMHLDTNSQVIIQ